MKRTDILTKLKQEEPFDVLVIGGGSAGLGTALDAVSRGFKAALVEKYDFGKGTSSKATKLLHGGVRYLAQGNIRLVFEALRERSHWVEHAPHLTSAQPFVIPIYKRRNALLYYIGLKIYDWLSAGHSLGKSCWLNKEETITALPNIRKKGLKGGVRYYDGQFDDSRFCIDLVHTVHRHGGLCANYVAFKEYKIADDGSLTALVEDRRTGEEWTVAARSYVHATGVFFEQGLGGLDADLKFKIVASRGAHLVVDRSFLNGDEAVMIPKTSDGRVLFLVPWKNAVIMGTTDRRDYHIDADVRANDADINFILRNAARYLEHAPRRKDILSSFAGLRPLITPRHSDHKTKELSRDHKVLLLRPKVYALLGGKWTTFRKMGEDVLSRMINDAALEDRPSTSRDMYLHASDFTPPEATGRMHADLPYSMDQIRQMIENEYVEKLEDVLARRSRCAFLNKKATLEIAEEVLDILADKKGFSTEEKVREQKDFENFMAYF